MGVETTQVDKEDEKFHLRHSLNPSCDNRENHYHQHNSLHPHYPHNKPTYLHPTIQEPCDPHLADCTELPNSLGEQLMTRKALCYLIIIAAVMAVISYIMNLVTADFLFYSDDSGFPGIYKIMIGSLLLLVITSYVAFHLTASSQHPTLVFWMYIVSILTYVFSIINLATRTEYYVKKVRIPNNGSVWLIVCLLSTMITFYVASQVAWGITVLALLPILWLTYLIYNWWFKVTTRFT